LKKSKNFPRILFRFRYYNMSTKQVLRRYANSEDTKCLVKLYKAYLELVPSTGPFYRRPLQTRKQFQLYVQI